jgi:hypothetical protein
VVANVLYSFLDVGCRAVGRIIGNPPGTNQTGNWSVFLGSGTFLTPQSYATDVDVLSVGSVYRWTLYGCGGSTFSDVKVKRYTQVSPALINISALSINCQSAIVSAGAEPVVNGIGTWSVVNGSGIPLFSHVATTPISSMSDVFNVFEWRVSGPFCNDDVAYLTVDRTSEQQFLGPPPPQEPSPRLQKCLCSEVPLSQGGFVSSCDPLVPIVLTSGVVFNVPLSLESVTTTNSSVVIVSSVMIVSQNFSISNSSVLILQSSLTVGGSFFMLDTPSLSFGPNSSVIVITGEAVFAGSLVFSVPTTATSGTQTYVLAR